MLLVEGTTSEAGESRKPATMKKMTEGANGGKAKTTSALDDLIQQGARQIIQQAVEAELAAMLEQYSNVKSIDGRRAVVRNGYLPGREVITATGPVTLKVPKVRDRSGSGIRFNSTVVPPYVRKSARVSVALPWLYLRGISTGDMGEAMGIMLGGEVSGMSPNVVSRLKAQWADEHEQWNRRELSSARWVYWWADGIRTAARSEEARFAGGSAAGLRRRRDGILGCDRGSVPTDEASALLVSQDGQRA